jgi:hypothetical protein
VTEADSDTSAQVRRLLGQGLGRHGIRRCVLDEDRREWPAWVTALVWVIAGVSALASQLVITFAITDALHVGLLALLAPGAVFVATVTFTVRFPVAGVIAWLAFGIVEGLLVSWGLVLISHAAPLALFALIGVTWVAASIIRDLDAEGLGRAAPLGIAAALSFLLIPLFTPELWEVAGRLSPIRAVVIAVIVIVPLVLFIRGPIRAVLENVTLPDIAAQPASVSSAMTRIEELADEPLDPATWRAAESCVTSAFTEATNVQVATAVRETLMPDVRAVVDRDLVLLVGAMTAILLLYFYAVAALAVPRDIAEKWAHGQTVGPTVHLGSEEIWIPIVPYLPVSGALALLATGILLALGVTEGSHSAAMASRLFGKRLAGAWLLAVPYLRLRSEALAQQRVEVTEEVRALIEHLPGVTVAHLLSVLPERKAAPTHEVLEDLRERGVIVIEGGRVGAAGPVPGIEAIDALVAKAQDTGTRVTVQHSGDGRPLPRLVGAAAHHLVAQLLRSLADDASSETSATVFLERADDALAIRVEPLTSPSAWSLRKSAQALGAAPNDPKPKESWAMRIRLAYEVPAGDWPSASSVSTAS